MNRPVRASIYNFSALLVLVGVAFYLTRWMYAPYLFALGTAGMAVIHFTAPYRQLDFRRRRLHRFNVLASFLMIAASAFMFKRRTEWIACLFIAAVLQLYAAFAAPDKK